VGKVLELLHSCLQLDREREDKKEDRRVPLLSPDEETEEPSASLCASEQEEGKKGPPSGRKKRARGGKRGGIGRILGKYTFYLNWRGEKKKMEEKQSRSPLSDQAGYEERSRKAGAEPFAQKRKKGKGGHKGEKASHELLSHRPQEGGKRGRRKTKEHCDTP